MDRDFARMLRLPILGVLVAASLASMAGAEEAEKPVAEQLVDALNTLFGKHPGSRATHAKGLVAEGEFTPAPGAAGLSKAAHLQGRPVRVTFRFSDGTGLPDVPDGASIANPHGVALRFHLPEGGSTDLLTNAFNGFAVATPEEFVTFLRAVAASGPAVPKPTPLEKFLGTHPIALKVVTAPQKTPVSFATEPYFGVNAFLFTNKEGKARYGRYQIRPEADVAFLSNEDAAKKAPNFLFDELRERLARGPAKFRLVVQLAAEGDPTDDASAVWPEDRPVVELGTLSVNRPAPDNEMAQKALGFDPLRLVDGIEGSDDPLLQIRPAVYAISRRLRK